MTQQIVNLIFKLCDHELPGPQFCRQQSYCIAFKDTSQKAIQINLFFFPLPCSYGHQYTRPAHEGKHLKRTQCSRSLTACGPGIHTISLYRGVWQGHAVITQLYMKLSGVGTGEAKGSMHYILCCIVTQAAALKTWLTIDSV